jgi:flavin-dependent dehydrogenase
MSGDRYHGGFLTAGLRPATAGGVFVVGDAAGHCLPLTGEGIRPAVFFAQRLAGIIDQELTGTIDHALALDIYRVQQARFAKRYRLLRKAQTALRGWPDPPVGTFLAAFSRGFMYEWLCRAYWDVAAPINPLVGGAATAVGGAATVDGTVATSEGQPADDRARVPV